MTYLRYYLGRPAQPKKVFVFVVKLTFKEGTRDAWLAGWKHLADYCIANEPNTLSVCDGASAIVLADRVYY